MKLDAFFLEYDDDRSGDFRPLRYLSKGKIVVCGTLDELRQMHNEQDLEELFFSLVS